MYSTTSKDEVVIKLVGKLSLEFPDIDQLKARNVVEEVLYKYNIEPTETALTISDIEEKMQIYLASKKLDGISKNTLKNYRYQLLIFAGHLIKPLASITTMDLRMYLAARCKGLKPSSINGQISVLKSFFGWLYYEERNIKMEYEYSLTLIDVDKILADDMVTILSRLRKDIEIELTDSLYNTYYFNNKYCISFNYAQIYHLSVKTDSLSLLGQVLKSVGDSLELLGYKINGVL
ncbi:phage integrase [Clostridium scatologenes]|uniref:Phage integrase n=1 Tax=Clostridium scatologenes TaxID=1548 RepID=A0A0E3GQG3_CLOSL|nr:phage integrase [Clostridium scatologenes]